MNFLLSFSTEHDQMTAKDIIASDNKVRSELTLVSEQKTGSWGNVRADSGLSARVESLQLKIGRHEEIDELCVCCSSGTASVDVGCDIMYLLAVLFNDYRSSSCSGISGEDNTSFELHSDDGCSCLFVGEWLNCLFLFQELVSEWGWLYLCVRAKSNPPICYE